MKFIPQSWFVETPVVDARRGTFGGSVTGSEAYEIEKHGVGGERRRLGRAEKTAWLEESLLGVRITG